MPVLRRSRRNLALWVLLLFTGACFAGNSIFSSPKYRYSVSLPDGWIQVPDAEIARFKAERLPPQAQHLIYDSGFQRGNAGQWFEWPYLLIQVIPSQRIGISRLPSEAEFQQLVSAMARGKSLSQVESAVSSVQDPNDRRYAESLIASLSSTTVQIDLKKRKYWFVSEASDPSIGAIKPFFTGYFLADGNLLQINCYSKATDFNDHLGHFAAIISSFQSSAVAPAAAPTLQPKPRATRDAFDT